MGSGERRAFIPGSALLPVPQDDVSCAMPPKLLTDLPADVVQHIVVRIQLAHHIGRAAPTCKVISVAARNALKVRQFSGEVVTLAEHTGPVDCVAAAPDGLRFVSGSDDNTARIVYHGLAAPQ